MRGVASIRLVWLGLWLIPLYHCGGSRPLAENRLPLAFVPFATTRLTPDAEALNRDLMQALISSGSFDVLLVESPAGRRDARHLRNLPIEEEVKYILTGTFVQETEQVGKGKNIPMVAYLPRKEVKVNLEVRVFDREKMGWKTIRRLSAVEGIASGVQVTAFDPSDPDLALTAKERARLRQQAYARLFHQLVRLLEKELDIKR